MPITSLQFNAALWTLIGLLAGGVRTLSLARPSRWTTWALDEFVGTSGALPLAWFVWPLHGELMGSVGMAPSGLLWAAFGSFFTLYVRQMFTS